MNYHHLYHAGNFADVFKHSLLIGLLQALQRKDKPFCYLETHAGSGLYDLQAHAAQKTVEYQAGINRLLTQNPLPLLAAELVKVVKHYNTGSSSSRYYPGSPLVARHWLRNADRMILMEKQAEEYRLLKSGFHADRQVNVHHCDGYAGLRALLPPKEKRGLLLIDPPFEQKDEFDQVLRALKTVGQRWVQGTTAVWYPVKLRAEIQPFHRRLKGLGMRKILCLELCVLPADVGNRLNGCGLILINPPWQFEQQAENLLKGLCPLLSQSAADCSVAWLVAE